MRLESALHMLKLLAPSKSKLQSAGDKLTGVVADLIQFAPVMICQLDRRARRQSSIEKVEKEATRTRTAKTPLSLPLFPRATIDSSERVCLTKLEAGRTLVADENQLAGNWWLLPYPLGLSARIDPVAGWPTALQTVTYES